MVLVVKDRIKDTSSTSGSGTISLDNSPPAGYQAFSTLGNGSTTYYAIQGSDDSFEIGLGTYNANTLTRTTILSSSNNGVIINLPSGSHTVWVDYPAAKAYLSEEGIDKSFTSTAGIAAGKPVILNSAGTVTQVAESTSDAAPGVGTPLTLDSSVNGSDNRTSLVYMDGIGSGVKTFLKIFCDGGTSNHITAIAFTISDTGARTITAGTPVVVTSNDTSTMDAVFDPDTNRVVMVYRNGDASNQAYYSVISVSGTTVTAGTVATLDNNNSIDARDLAITYDTSADRLAVVYYDQGASGQIRSYVGTVTGGTTNSVAWGSNVDAEGAASNVFTRLCYDVATNRHLLVWRNDSGLQSKVGTLTGSSTNTLAWGSKTTLNTTSVADIELPMIAYEATQEKCVLGWFSGSSTQKFGVVTVTGASTNTAAIGSLISVTIDYVLHEPNSNALSAIAASKVAYVYNVSDTVKVVPFTISGTSLSAGTAVTVASADTSNIQIAGVVATGAAAITFETNNVSINAIEYRSANIPGGGPVVTNLTPTNYFGVASTSASANASVNINIPGSINNDQVGLTVGQDYYATGQGNILPRSTTTNSPNSDISSSNGNEIASVQNYTRDISVAYDTTNDKIGVLYANSNHYPTIAIGSESNNAITWGTPVVVNSASSSPTNHSGQKLAYGNGVFVASYFLDSNDTNYIKAGSYSGTNSITLGSAIQPNTGTSHFTGGTIAYNPNANKFVYTFAENSSTSIIAYLITNSGTTLTTGNSATITMGYTGNNKVIWNGYDPDTNKQVIMTDHLYGDEGRIYQATISGANITVPSTHYAITDEGSEEDGSKTLSYDPDNNKWLLFKAQAGNVLRANVLTVSGDTFTSGTVTQLSSQYMRWLAPYYDTEQNKTVLVSNKNTSGYYGIIGFVTISGTTPSYTASATTVGNQTAERLYTHTSLYNPDTKSGIVIGATPLSSSKAVGYVLYYGTTASSVINGSQFVGKAISSTQLLLGEEKGNSMAGLSNGAITKGKPVLMQADGDVAQAKETSSSITFAQGSATEIEEGWLDQRVISYDVGENKFLVAYRDQDNSSHGYCKVLSVSGTTVSYGSQSSAFNSNSTNVIDSVYDVESGNHVIFYTNSSQYGYAVVASISGTSVTFGTPVAFNSASTHYRGTCFYDSTNKKVVWVGGHFSGSYLLKAVVGTVSGTSITFGSLQDSGVSDTDYYSSAYDTNSSVGVYAYRNSSGDGYIGTLSISGTSITWNTPVNFNGSDNVVQQFDSMTYDSVNKKIVHTFKDSATNSLKAIVGTVSGTSISFGTKVEAVSNGNGGQTNYFSVVGTLQGVVPLVYKDDSNGYLKYLQGTVSGTSISFAGGVTLDSTNIENVPAIAYDSNNYGIVTSYSDSSTHDLWALAVTPSGNVVSGNLTATNYLGIASNTVADNEECIINTQGAVNPDQSSLTAGQLYYVQTDGTLSTTAGSPSVIAGIATSATTLLVTKS